MGIAQNGLLATIDILSWLREFQVKIAIFKDSFVSQKRHLDTKKTSNIDVCLQVEYWCIEGSLFRLGHGIYTSGPQVKIKISYHVALLLKNVHLENLAAKVEKHLTVNLPESI